ncbi:hypothetical protein ACFVAJ_18385 [Agromyces sp. NPDC057679]|uniref:hypothetical protein n=1 Tax=Agromyces sp. NPDC057679 TaxID=3346207 RepID=UPI003672068E
MPQHTINIVEANHDDNEFYTLGTAVFDDEVHRDANLAKIPPHDHDCDESSRCYLLDIIDPEDGWSVLNNIEISEDTAKLLLGTQDLEPLRELDRALVRSVIAAADARAGRRG